MNIRSFSIKEKVLVLCVKKHSFETDVTFPEFQATVKYDLYCSIPSLGLGLSAAD